MRGDRLIWILCATALALSAGAAGLPKELLAPKTFSAMAANGPSSSYIESSIVSNGQFTCGVPNGAILLYGHPSPWSGYTTIQVDGANYDNNGQDFGPVVKLPTTVGTVNEGIWTIGNIEVHQVIELVKGYSTNKEDTYLITYTLVNKDTVAHEAGARVMFDTDLAGNDGAPFQVPGTGSVTTGTIWKDANVPPYFFVFNDLNNPEVTAQGSLTGGEILLPPDTFTIAPWGCGSDSGGLYDNNWDYTITGENVTCDSAYAVYFLPRSIASGASVSYSTYYGLGGIEVDTRPPLVSSLTSPVYLDCRQVLTPNPFIVALYIENSVPGTSATVTGITATLSVPAGLRVAPGSETQQVADMAPRASNLLSWNVLADGTVRGDLQFSITIATADAGTKTTQRTISVPAGCPTGDLPPVVGITSPPAGSQLACTATLESSVWDDQGNVTIQYYLDGVAVGGPAITPPYEYQLDLQGAASGQHLVYSTATDSTGHTTKSNKISFSISNPEILAVSLEGKGKKMRVYGENLREGYSVTVRGASQATTLKSEATSLYKTDFATFNANSWMVDGSYSHSEKKNKGSGGEVTLGHGSTMARSVSTEGFSHIKVNISYDYSDMDEGEGVLLEYSLAGSDGPWIGGFSDLSAKPNGKTDGWRKGAFLCPSSASNLSTFWIRLRSVLTQNHRGPDGVLTMGSVNVVSLKDYLFARKVPQIGPAQTVPVTILYETCETDTYLYTRP